MLRHFGILCLVATWLSATVVVDAEVADIVFLKNQEKVFKLLWRCEQPEMYEESYILGKDYDVEANIGSFKNETDVKNFVELYKRGMLPRGEIFSVYYEPHEEQAIALFKVFHSANDFDAFFKFASWARIYLNEGLFVYACSIAVVHSPVTRGMVVPAHHETYPHLYFDNQVIQQAYYAKMSTDPTTVSAESPIIIASDYSTPQFHKGNNIRYFTEDISLNGIQYWAHLGHPHWLPTDGYERMSTRRGEVFFWSYRLLWVRYCMEGPAVGCDQGADFDLSQPIPHGFLPTSSYHNGLPIPHREAQCSVPSHKYKLLSLIRSYEHDIQTAIDSGYVIDKSGSPVPIHTPNGILILGNLIEGNADSINPGMYGSLDRTYRNILGFNPEPIGKYKVLPSMLQQFGAEQRDPMYWSIVKKIFDYYQSFASKLPKYTKDELYFPDVTIQSVSADRITTFFTSADYLISNAVRIFDKNDKTQIFARKSVLDHKPCTLTITVNSTKPQKVNVRTFIGLGDQDLHHKKIDLTENWKNFFIVDEWVAELTAGINKIKRSSTQAYSSGPDQLRGDLFLEKLEMAMNNTYTYEIPTIPYSYPRRMLFPKGSASGTPYQVFAFIAPYDPENYYHSHAPIFGYKNYKNCSLGWPLDRPPMYGLVDFPNAFAEKFLVYHEDESTINQTY